MTEQSTVTEVPAPELAAEEHPAQPTLSGMFDQIFAHEDPLLRSCLTDAINLWWRSQGLTGRGLASEDDAMRLLRSLLLVVQAREGRHPGVSEFAPRGKLSGEQRDRVISEISERITPPPVPSFVRQR